MKPAQVTGRLRTANRDQSSHHHEARAARVAVAHMGARMHYAVPTLLHRSGLLHQFFTDTYAGPGSVLGTALRMIPERWQPNRVRRLAQRRADLPAHLVTSYTALGFAMARAMATGDASDAYLKYNRIFGRKITQSSHLSTATHVYAYTTCALEMLTYAREHGIRCVLEQMSAPLSVMTNAIMAEEARWPGWENEEAELWRDPAWRSRESAEWQLADTIIAPSVFVRDGLVESGVDPAKIRLIPYAVSLKQHAGSVRRFDGQRPLRILFVGTVRRLKGVPYLLEALRLMPPNAVECRLVGSIGMHPDKLAPYASVATFTGKISRRAVADQYQWADIFAMPSICEGSATVTYESRAMGLPIIATPNSGAWIEDARDGVYVEPRDPQALAEAFARFVDEPGLVESMSRQALRNAETYSFDAYTSRLNTLFRDD